MLECMAMWKSSEEFRRVPGVGGDFRRTGEKNGREIGGLEDTVVARKDVGVSERCGKGPKEEWGRSGTL
jgi:hypothetical protein